MENEGKEPQERLEREEKYWQEKGGRERKGPQERLEREEK